MKNKLPKTLFDEWEDLSDLCLPYIYLKWIMGILNGIRNNAILFTDDAFENLKTFTLSVAQMVVRDVSKEDEDRIRDLIELPDWI